jgi:hypothetical protein
MITNSVRRKPQPRKQRSTLDIQQVLDDLDAVLESSQPLGKGHLENAAGVRKPRRAVARNWRKAH